MPAPAAEPSRDSRPMLLAVGFQIESTGLTRVMNGILERLASRYEIHHVGIGYRGAPR